MGGATPAAATDVQDGFADTLVASVESPTALEFTPDGRLLVTTQFGELRIVQDGSLLAQPALDLGSVLCTSNEQGLLGVAVDPAFASNGFVFLYYTRSKSGRCVNRVSRFTMSGSTISTATESVLVDEIPAPSGNHNGGDLEFGKDGYLYVSVGDGACDYAGGGCYSGNDAARDVHALVGKILRITSTGGIPPTNPFQGAGTARCNVTGVTTAGTRCQETFSWGLRNPFRMAFDPNAAGTRFFINDVGDGAWEEVDEGLAGADYGWNVREGPCANNSFTSCGAPPAGMTNPVYAYSHNESSCHAITGGAFVPNGVWPAAYDNTYLYGDYTCGKIFRLTPNGTGGYVRTEFAADLGAVVNMTFGPSPFGRGLYYTNYDGGGQVRRIDYVASDNRPPNAALTASPTYGALPLDVSFDGSGSSDPDAGDTLTYRWDFGDGSQVSTTSTPTTAHTYTTAGPFTARLTVLDQDGASNSASVVVDPGNTPPTISFESPSETDRFAVGESITLRATASDAQDGSLGPGNLSWRVLRHHDAHTHPFLAPTTGNDIVITQPAPEDLRSGIDGYLEVQLTATDSRGLSTVVTRNVLPQKVSLTFASNPSGRDLVVGDTTYATPATVTSWEAHAIGVEARSQTDGTGRSWTFSSWSDGGAAAHTIVTPATPTTYTATFTESAVPAGLVGGYGFEEASGTAVTDRSGRGNNGVISGATRTAAGRFGAALSFDGTNDWVTIADSASLDVTTGLTLSAWVRPTTVGGWRTVAMKERPGGIVYSLYAAQGGSRPLGQVDIGGERNAVGTAAVPLNAWTHLATTFDGSFVRLYVNGTLASSTAISGSVPASTGALRIGGTSVWSEWYAGLIDEVRVYERPLTAAQIQADMASPVASAPPADTSAPTAPSGLAASSGVGSASLSWSASSDNVGVARYNVHRSATAGFTPSAANRVGQPVATSFADSGLAAGTYYYRVSAEDAAGNVSPYSAELTVVVPPDNPPTVSLTAPAPGATVAGVVTLSASASDDVAVAGVTFRVGTVDLVPEDTTAPYSTSWDTRTVANGSYVLRAVARDSAAQSTTSASVTVTVNNPPPPPPSSGLVAAFGFEEASGTAVTDRSGRGNNGVISGATRTAAGRYGAAVSFDGVNDWVTVADSASLDLSSAATVSAWVRPSAAGGWRTVVFKERPGGVVYSLYADHGTSRPVAQVYLGGERSAVGSAPVPVNAWTHLAATFDGSAVRLFVNGVQAGSFTVAGSMQASTGALRIGGNSIWSEWFAGLIDEVRVYDRALSTAEIQNDMQAPVQGAPAPDSSPPSAPTGVSASAQNGAVTLTWSASSDNVGVVRYNVHRSTTAGFTPSAANRVGQPTGTTFVDSGLAAGTYRYRISAEDAAGNVSGYSAEANATVQSAPAPGTGLVAAYGFEEGAGTGVADRSGNGNDGVVTGATWTAGRYGSGLSFDGTNDWVTVPDSASLDLSSELTVSAWVNPSSLGGWRTVLFKERSGGMVYALYGAEGGARPAGQVWLGGERTAAGSAAIPSDAWTHLAATSDGSTLRLYVNGTLAASTAAGGSLQASSGPLRIGGNSVWTEWFAGVIDEVRVYTRVLSAAEIEADMQAPVE